MHDGKLALTLSACATSAPALARRSVTRQTYDTCTPASCHANGRVRGYRYLRLVYPTIPSAPVHWQ